MERKIFFVDNNSKKMKWLETAIFRFMVMSIIDVFVLLAVMFTILLLLNEYGVANLYVGSDISVLYISVVMAYIVINAIFSVFDFIKHIKLSNRIIVKENNDITFGLFGIGGEVQKNKKNKNRKIAIEVNKIFDERPKGYKFIDYKDCKLLKETKNYYVFTGNKNGLPSRFKIYKIYYNINFITKEEN